MSDKFPEQSDEEMARKLHNLTLKSEDHSDFFEDYLRTTMYQRVKIFSVITLGSITAAFAFRTVDQEKQFIAGCIAAALGCYLIHDFIKGQTIKKNLRNLQEENPVRFQLVLNDFDRVFGNKEEESDNENEDNAEES